MSTFYGALRDAAGGILAFALVGIVVWRLSALGEWVGRRIADRQNAMDADLAADILADHRDGFHDEYDHPSGCAYPGCDQAFWLHARAQEHG